MEEDVFAAYFDIRDRFEQLSRRLFTLTDRIALYHNIIVLLSSMPF